MKFVNTFSMLVASSVVASASFSTQEFLYKDPRVMGMGGANIAVGGYSSSVFSNPAGLATLKNKEGFDVELLGISVGASKDLKDFADDIKDVEEADEAVTVLDKYSGDAFSISLANYSSITYHIDSSTVVNFGILAAGDGTFISHGNGSKDGLLEAHTRVYGAVILSGAKTFDNLLPGNVTFGLGIKYVKQNSYEAALDVDDIANHSDDLDTYLKDEYKKEDSGVGVDIGILYEPNIEAINFLHPRVGLSVLNIGNLDFDNYGAQPTTVNVGMAISPEVPYISSLTVAVDIVDITNEQQARIMNSKTGEYENVDIAFDFLQHLKAGVSIGLFENEWTNIRLNTGVYQGDISAGLELDVFGGKLQFTTYQEQLGSETGQLEDRRYMLGFGIGW